MSTSDLYDRRIRICDEVFDALPTYVRFVLLAEGRQVEGADLGALWTEYVAPFSGNADVLSDPRLVFWREAFTSLGINPKRFSPAVDALAHRVVKSGLSPLGLPLVDMGTILSLKYLIPVGVHVLNGLPSGDLEVERAEGTESFELFDGSSEKPAEGELIYRVGSVVLTRRWLWRQGRVGSVEADSHALAINLDVPSEDLVDSDRLLTDVEGLLHEVGFKLQGVARLSSTSRSVDLKTVRGMR